MTNNLFGSIISGGDITGFTFLVATFFSLGIGMFLAFMYTIKNKYSMSFIVTLALLPAIVQVIIMMVNGNIGAGVAVAGTFSLVRFRSVPGTGKEITNIFLAMAVGLTTGMGYLGIAVIFAVIMTVANLLFTKLLTNTAEKNEKILKISIPESLDFEGIFDDILSKYAEHANLEDVKTVGMGSLYRLTYKIVLKNNASVKAMIDEIRVRNGNLEVSCSRPVSFKTEEL